MTQTPAELAELQAAGIIDEETARQIADYWGMEQPERPSRLPVVFSVLGALLVGLGIILVVAHNWDMLSHFTKMLLAFLPVLIGQGASWYTLRKRPESSAWREGSGVFLLFALGACVAMVSQIYHVEGSMEEFLFLWIILALPIIYVLDSGLVSLFFWLGISIYAFDAAYDGYPRKPAYWYLVFAAAALPYYWRLLRRQPNSNKEMFHSWAIPLSLIVCLNTLFVRGNVLNWVDYQLLAALLFVVGRWLVKREGGLLRNGWMIIGLCATVFIGLAESFIDYWDSREVLWSEGMIYGTNFYVFLLLLAALVGVVFYVSRKDSTILQHPVPYLGLTAIVIHLIGVQSPFVGAVIGNLLVLGLGIYYIWLGTRSEHLAILNFGMIMLTALIACRFFDTDISFAVRGLLFLLMGAAFFGANTYLIKRRARKS